ncbi:MAG: hypothetical protein OEN01_07795 [Candidatus Krumholzibacteria bacterium]|nr:hypothetical protein [Candidatus Krumholzibacteria bacterium]
MRGSERRKVTSCQLLGLAAFVSMASVSCRPDAQSQSRSPTAHATVEVSYEQVPAQARAAFQFATDAWSSILVSDVPIKIRVSFTPLLTRGLCVPNAVRDFDGASEANTWYPSSLADAIANRDLQPGEYDMEIFFSTSTNWYFGNDGRPAKGKSDFVFIAMHEICHGLGFASLLKVSGGFGSYGRNVFDSAPQVSFQIPDLGGMPSIFDRFVENQSGNRLVDAFPSPSVRLGMELSRSRLFFGGANAIHRNSKRRPRLHSRDPSHLDRQFYEPDPINGMMTPGPGHVSAIHDPGSIVKGVLEDLGWRIKEERRDAEPGL